MSKGIVPLLRKAGFNRIFKKIRDIEIRDGLSGVVMPNSRSVLAGALLLFFTMGTCRAQERLLAGPGDYDGDGSADIAVFRPARGLWAIRGLSGFYFGGSSDLPAPADFDGDRTADAAIFRPGNGLWAIRGLSRFYWGKSVDIPVPADFDGDRTADAALYRESAGLWVVRGMTRRYFGAGGDLPLRGDYDGDGTGEIGIFRPGSGLWAIAGKTRFYYGKKGDVPVPAAYQAGPTRAALFRPGNGLWAIRGFTRFYLGDGTDWAVPAPYGGGEVIPALFRPGSSLWAVRGTTRCYFGRRGDLPVSGTSGKVRKVRLPEVSFWAYNIAEVNTTRQREVLTHSHFDLYVLEPVVTEKGEESFDIAGLVRDIREYNIEHYQKDPLILAYVDIGQAEDWRWYWQSGWKIGDPAWIVAGDPDGWDGCYPVAYWYPEWEDIVIYGSGGRSQVEETLKAGFDGIYLDWVEAYDDEDVKKKADADGVDPVARIFDLIEKIRLYARSASPRADPDYLVIAQNAAALYQENQARYLDLIDAISQEGVWYDGTGGFDDWKDQNGYNIPTDDIYPGWTEELLEDLGKMKGKLPIFCAEYAQDTAGFNRASEVYNARAPAEGFIPYCTRRSLSRLSTGPYPAGYLPRDYTY